MPTQFIPLIKRIKFDEVTGCWNWRGSRNNGGYGNVRFQGKPRKAHRLSAHLWLNLPIDDKRCVLHRCDNPGCWNPKHLFIGTQLENMRDAISKGRAPQLVSKPFCGRGHDMSQGNVSVSRSGHRACRECLRIESLKHYYKKKGKTLEEKDYFRKRPVRHFATGGLRGTSTPSRSGELV